jgi:hypothetical protein
MQTVTQPTNGDEGAKHDKVALREVDHRDRIPDQRIAERHERVDGANGEPGDQDLNEDLNHGG